MILVTTYYNSDLDGYACSRGYAELLNNSGKEAYAAIFGGIIKETRYLLDRFNISPLGSIETPDDPRDDIVLTDTHRLGSLKGRIDPARVIEIIDHHEALDDIAATFPYARVQNERVGAAATLIAERFQNAHIAPATPTAILLWGAIYSNTLYFRAAVTTPRDRHAAQWLQGIHRLDESLIHDMFRAKSMITDDEIHGSLEHDLWKRAIAGEEIAYFQMEIIESDRFIAQHRMAMQAILQEYRDKGFTYSFISILDLEKGVNRFITADTKCQALLSSLISLQWEDDIGSIDHLILRKELGPQILRYLSAHQS